jgi:hypothetical protein
MTWFEFAPLGVSFVALLGGCDRLFGLRSLREAMPDVTLDDWVNPPSNVDVDHVPAPTGALLISGTMIYHTDTGVLDGSAPPASMLDPGPNPDLRVVSVTALTVEPSGVLVIVGPHPVVFVVHGKARIDGTIDASARLDAMWNAGPGGEVACTSGIGLNGISASGGAGGGGGGGFGAPGGAGGPCDGGGAVIGGMVEGSAAISPLRGGCRGGSGGTGAASGGAGGRGGGAVQLAVRDSLIMNGEIRASGGPGGAGLANDGGGGGGGSGGAILLEASEIQIGNGAAVCANGGGGGGGASDNATNGVIGTIGLCAVSPAAAGAGGSGGGGAGGNGSYGAVAAGGGTSGASEGAGGGGGGAGRIRIDAIVRTGSGPVSPLAM